MTTTHKLKFAVRDGYIHLDEVWCPGDHDGVCDSPTMEEQPEPACFWPEGVKYGTPEYDEWQRHADGCQLCQDYDEHGSMRPTGPCWPGTWLAEMVCESGGWEDCLKGTLPVVNDWVECEITSCGPECDDPIYVYVLPKATP